MNTLRGIFPEPPTIPKRNFIRENMVHIKQMQGLVDSGGDRSSTTRKPKQGRPESTSSHRTMKLIQSTRKQLQGLAKLSKTERPTDKADATDKTANTRKVSKKRSIQSNDEQTVYKTAVEALKESLERRGRVKEIGIQTEQFSNVAQLYETGTIKYPSSHIISMFAQKKSPEVVRRTVDNKSPELSGDGDRKSDPPGDVSSHSPKHDFVKENAQVVKHSTVKPSPTKDPTMPPPTYQKGVVPKYLRERKEELSKQLQNAEDDDRCPQGHVVLPENERKETLRMLRQSYAELVTELNMLPVRSDTLKIRNRKIEIENQLKKLDEGIKVFTRPKVYVKIGA